MRSYHTLFFLPILLLWGSLLLSGSDPVLIQSDIRIAPEIERGDLLRIAPGGEIALDGLVIYRQNRIDYVARVIGLPGDAIALGLDGNSVVRNGERVQLAPRGQQISMPDPQSLTVEPGQAAVFVSGARRNPISLVIDQAAIRGSIDKIYRYTNLGRSEWLTIAFDSLIVLTLVVLPYLAFLRQRPPTLLRTTSLVIHTFMVLAVAAMLFALSLPGDPMGLGAAAPIWWWFPLAVVSGFSLELVLAAGLFLLLLWLLVDKPWRKCYPSNNRSA